MTASVTEETGCDLLARSARGVGWVFAWRMATRLIGLASTLIMVRLLAPADFGLVALASGVANLVEQFGWIGIEGAIVRQKQPGRDVFDTGFTLGLLRSLLLGGVIAAAAPAAAAWFHEPRLQPVLLALAAASACMGAENVGVVEFRRALAFDREFRYLLLPRLLSAALGIATALIWRSYWALIVGIVSARLLRVLASYVMHPFRPRLSLAAWRRLAFYSTGTWLLGIAALLRDRADALVIGRAMGTEAVGLYMIGYEIAALGFVEIVEALQRPVFSAFVAARHAGLPIRGPFLRILGGVGLVALPAGLGLSLVAGPAIAVLAGPRWQEAAPLVRILAAAGTLSVAGALCRTLLTADGRLRIVGAITLSSGAARLGSLVALVPLAGLRGAAYAAAATMALEAALFLAAVLRCERIGLGAMLDVVWRPALASLVMALVLRAAGLGWAAPGDTPLAALVGSCGLGATAYAAALLSLWWLAGRPDGPERSALRLVGGRSAVSRS